MVQKSLEFFKKGVKSLKLDNFLYKTHSLCGICCLRSLKICLTCRLLCVQLNGYSHIFFSLKWGTFCHYYFHEHLLQRTLSNIYTFRTSFDTNELSDFHIHSTLCNLKKAEKVVAFLTVFFCYASFRLSKPFCYLFMCIYHIIFFITIVFSQWNQNLQSSRKLQSENLKQIITSWILNLISVLICTHT